MKALRRLILGLVLTGLVVLVLAALLAATVPARFVAGLADPEDQAGLRQVQGTLWRGQAQIRPGTGSAVDLEWAWQLPAEWAVTARGDGMDIQGLARPGQGGLGLSDVRGVVPVARTDLGLWLPHVTPEGELHLDLPRVDFDGHTVSGLEGTIRWEDARLRGAVEESLGTVEVVFEPDETGILARVASLEPAPVSVRGSLRLEDGAYATDLWLRAEPGRPELSRQLARIGEIQPDGQVRLQREGRFLP